MTTTAGKVLLTTLLGDRGPHFEMLQDASFDVAVVDRQLDLWQEDNLIAALRDCEACIAGSEPYTPKVISACPKLRVIARTGVGFDAINLRACDQAQIVVATT